MLPQAIDFEEAVLGALMLEPRISDKVATVLIPDIFYLDKNQYVCEAIMDLYQANIPIDIIAVTEKLKAKGHIDIVGGPYYIAQLTSKVSSTANIEFHIAVLQQKSLQRNLIRICGHTITDAFDDSADAFKIMDNLQEGIDAAYKQIIRYEVSKIDSLHEAALKESLEVLNHGRTSGVPTGLRMLDKATSGWQKTDLIIIAGRPAMGKTALAVSMIKNGAIDFKKPVAIFSLEMSKEQLTARIQSNMSGVDVSKIIKKQLTKEEIDLISLRCLPLIKAPIFIDDTPAITVLEFKAKARRLVAEHGVEEIYVDYLQLMRSGENKQVREQEIAEISRGLKSTAKELNIPIIALAQLSREVEKRGDKKPILQDLRESGQLEQDADMVGFCYRPEYYGIDSYEIDGQIFDAKGLFMFIIAKYRNGACGEIPMNFIGRQTMVTNWTENPEFESHTPVEPAIEEPQKSLEQNTARSMYEIGKSLLEDKETAEDLPF